MHLVELENKKKILIMYYLKFVDTTYNLHKARKKTQ